MSEPASTGVLGYGTSDDHGATWRAGLLPAAPDGGGQSDPWLTTDAAGSVYAASYVACTVAVARSGDRGSTWEPWSTVPSGSGCADKPMLVGRTPRGVLAVYHVLGDGGRGRIEVARSDDGVVWGPPGAVPANDADDRLAPAAVLLPDGTLLVTWWSHATLDVEAAASSDGGATWHAPVRLNARPGSVIDDRVPGRLPLHPPFPSLAAAGGTVVGAWPEAQGGRWDVFTARSTDGGRTWSAASRLPGPEGGDRFLVSLSPGKDRSVVAAWYHRTAAATEVRTARSTDAGRTWTELGAPLAAGGAGPSRLGDYLGLAVGSGGDVHVAWTLSRDGALQVWAAAHQDPP